MSTIKKVLILAPHTDDGELGCGGTISRFIEEGHDVYYVAFSACKQSVLSHFPEDILTFELKKATAVLGIKPENLILLDYEVRTFNYRRQEILDDILKIKNKLTPDIVFMPTLTDIHQDHYTIANEGVRAFKFSTIYCYELPWNNFSFNSSCFFILTKEQLNKKILAMAQYESQAHRPYANENFITSLAAVRGVQGGQKYAEAFELIRLIN